jgi:DNA-binding CsgD family transcriptional regulator
MGRSEHLVGRADELGAFDGLLDRLGQGEAAALELVGEPGIGKSRLLSELASRTDARGWTVLSGRATELEREFPFSVFVDALDEFLLALDTRRLGSLGPEVQTELATIFPSLEPGAARAQVALQEERYRTYRAVRLLLELLAQRQPLVLALDDVHWADPASVELLGTLLRRSPSAPVLMVLASRPRQTDERLSAIVQRAHRSQTLERIELGPLTRHEAGELVGAILDGAEPGLLYEESGGNPFYLEQLARSASRSAPDRPSRSGLSLEGVDVPPVVAAALGEELALLPEGTRLILEGASVAGDPFDPELAAAAADVSEGEVLNALDELLRLDLVRHTDVPRRFRFRHPLIRRAVYELTPGGRRLGAHERCAVTLRERGAPPSARAHHAEYAAREGDLSAVALLREAGEAAARRAPASAAQWFGSALRLLPQTAPSTERIELLLALANALGAIGRFRDAHVCLLEALEIVPPGDEPLLVRLTTGCAMAEHLLGRQKDAQAHLETALASLSDPESEEAAKLMIELAVDKFHIADWADMRAWAARAIETARPLGDPALLAAALGIQAWAASLAGAGVVAQEQRSEAADLVDSLPDDVLAGRVDALAHLAAAEMYLDHFEDSLAHARRGFDLSRATGHGDQFPLLIPALGSCLWILGRPAESADVYDGAIEAARLIGNLHALAWHLFNRTFAAIAEGDLDTALATAEESVELAADLVPGPVRGHAYVALAYTLMERGEPARAAELLVENVGGEELRMIGGGWRAHYLMFLTRARIESGDRAAAERAAAATRVCADDVGLPKAAAMAELAAAWLELGARRPLLAAERATAAVALLDGVAARFDAARARVLAGRSLAEARDVEGAAAVLGEAAAAFDASGSLRYRDEVDRELRKLGRRAPARRQPGSGDGLAALTARELEVARLVVDRRTNPEIAAELFLSQKTVETHLRNAFRKLDVSSRVELARAVERADRARV